VLRERLSTLTADAMSQRRARRHDVVCRDASVRRLRILVGLSCRYCGDGWVLGLEVDGGLGGGVGAACRISKSHPHPCSGFAYVWNTTVVSSTCQAQSPAFPMHSAVSQPCPALYIRNLFCELKIPPTASAPPTSPPSPNPLFPGHLLKHGRLVFYVFMDDCCV
jgi:hypothetical protein